MRPRIWEHIHKRENRCCTFHEISTSRSTVNSALRLPRNPYFKVLRSTKRCARQDLCASTFTKRCACHEICTSRSTTKPALQGSHSTAPATKSALPSAVPATKSAFQGPHCTAPATTSAHHDLTLRSPAKAFRSKSTSKDNIKMPSAVFARDFLQF